MFLMFCGEIRPVCNYGIRVTQVTWVTTTNNPSYLTRRCGHGDGGVSEWQVRGSAKVVSYVNLNWLVFMQNQFTLLLKNQALWGSVIFMSNHRPLVFYFKYVQKRIVLTLRIKLLRWLGCTSYLRYFYNQNLPVNISRSRQKWSWEYTRVTLLVGDRNYPTLDLGKTLKITCVKPTLQTGNSRWAILIPMKYIFI